MERDPRLDALAETRTRITAMEQLLAELPSLFERKFQQRLQPLLDQQQQLLNDNAALRQQLLSLRQADHPKHGLRLLLRETKKSDLNRPDGVLPTAASADPTRK